MRFLAILVLVACALPVVPASAADELPAPIPPAAQTPPSATPPEQKPGPPALPTDLDALFAELKAAPDADSAKVIEAGILQRFLKSGSDTVDLLMTWAIESINGEDYALALDLLDSVVTMKPDYAEGWNKRATVFFLQDEYGKALGDIREVLALQPRHFGALSGLGMILREIGEKQKAIAAFRQALAIDPYLENVKSALDDLVKEAGGRDI